ncbi:bifunctional UDP-sugar hydrolase/5'-nucleotidase [Massilia sp. X63]|uniref:bifunctional metallophosphatase/5'-nucleotidase n=1 Tax=Massilia sp. X63 TaxID=3237285 RepID=UPI0034DD7328
MKVHKAAMFVLAGLVFGMGAQANASERSGEVTLIHMGDLHGHLVPHASVRSDAAGKTEGGVARIYTLVERIRRAYPEKTLLVNTGDTLHGGAEALFTEGEAMIEVLNAFRFDAYAPGNWDYVYGAGKFLSYFTGPKPKARWNPVIANLYYDNYPGLSARNGQTVAPPYLIKQVDGLRVAIIGFTSDRGPQAGDEKVTAGLRFTDGKEEYAKHVKQVRAQDVDLVVVISELGLHGNLTLADAIPGVDVILSSDKHEITPRPVVSRNGTLIVEQGMDGQVVGELQVRVNKGVVADKRYVSHRITEQLAEDMRIAAMVAQVRAPLVSGPAFKPGAIVNPFSGARLRSPIDTVVGQTEVPLHRSNFSKERMPAVIEGSSHDFLADAFRRQGGAQLGMITGFRYGTAVAPGPIKLEDLYHFLPVGAQIARGELTGMQIKKALEGKAQNTQARTGEWINGWTAGISGLTADFDPQAPQGSRVSNMRINGEPVRMDATYTVAGLWYKEIPGLINRLPAKGVVVVKDEKGALLDGTDVVTRYLDSLPGKSVTKGGLQLDRIRLVKPLPAAQHGIVEIQPLGAVAR